MELQIKFHCRVHGHFSKPLLALVHVAHILARERGGVAITCCEVPNNSIRLGERRRLIVVGSVVGLAAHAPRQSVGRVFFASHFIDANNRVPAAHHSCFFVGILSLDFHFLVCDFVQKVWTKRVFRCNNLIQFYTTANEKPVVLRRRTEFLSRKNLDKKERSLRGSNSFTVLYNYVKISFLTKVMVDLVQSWTYFVQRCSKRALGFWSMTEKRPSPKIA